MENRFYYSSKQDEVCRDSFDYDYYNNYIQLDDGELVRYTQWCSTPDSKCNWDDAVLVATIDVENSNDLLSRIVRKK